MTTSWNPGLYTGKHSFVPEYGTSLIDLLNPQPGERILDVGCGTGELTVQLTKNSKDVIGIDASRSMIDHARKTYPNIDFRVEDVSDFELDRTFDALFSNATLHWVRQSEKAIQCMYRHLNSGGRLVLEMGGKGNISKIEQSLRSVLKAKGHLANAEKKVWYFPALGEYTRALENAGFRVSAAWFYDRPTPLKDNNDGIVDWIIMFGKAFMDGLSGDEQHQVAQEVQDMLVTELFQSGTWWADYKRLRVMAWK